MNDDSIGRPATPPPTAAAARGMPAGRGTCAIAPVRGDVTTTRALANVRAAAARAAAVWARRRDGGPAAEPVRGGPGAENFPAHLLRVGPA